MTDTPTTHKEMTLPESVTLYKVDIPNVGTMLTFAEPINPDCTFIMGEYTRHPKPMGQAEWGERQGVKYQFKEAMMQYRREMIDLLRECGASNKYQVMQGGQALMYVADRLEEGLQ